MADPLRTDKVLGCGGVNDIITRSSDGKNYSRGKTECDLFLYFHMLFTGVGHHLNLNDFGSDSG